jgi:hypothetical protein
MKKPPANMFRVTEWDWFKLQLRIHALEYSGEAFGESYRFDTAVPTIFTSGARIDAHVICSIYGDHVQTMIERGASKQEQLAYYLDWIEGQKQVMDTILESLPSLRSTLDLTSDVAYLIVYNYGMGGGPVCAVVNGEPRWSRAVGSLSPQRKRTVKQEKRVNSIARRRTP